MTCAHTVIEYYELICFGVIIEIEAAVKPCSCFGDESKMVLIQSRKICIIKVKGITVIILPGNKGFFIDRKKKLGYQKAVAEGRVGRPVKAKDLEKAISLYEEGRLDINQVVALTGVSKSTIYRYLNK